MTRPSVICAATAGSFLFLSTPTAVHAQKSRAPVKVPEAGVAFVVPAGYTLARGSTLAKANLNRNIVFVCQGPSQAGFFSNVNLVIQPAPPGVKADPASATALGSVIQNSFANYKELGSGSLTVGGEKAAFHSSTFTAQNHSIHMKQVLVIRGGKMYVFSFGAAVSAYAKAVGAFDAMLASLKWL